MNLIGTEAASNTLRATDDLKQRRPCVFPTDAGQVIPTHNVYNTPNHIMYIILYLYILYTSLDIST